jgi:iron-sulfur cluster assembly protein
MDQPGIHSAPTVKREEPKEGSKRSLKIDVTPAAIAQIAKLTAKRTAEGKAPKALRIGLRGGGCDGFSYVFEWSDGEPEARDHVFDFDLDLTAAQPPVPGMTKVRVYVDKKSLIYLQGTTLNFVTGLMGRGFKFENPNVKGACGCGESVHF